MFWIVDERVEFCWPVAFWVVLVVAPFARRIVAWLVKG
jgi:hypothetical protein